MSQLDDLLASVDGKITVGDFIIVLKEAKRIKTKYQTATRKR